MTETAEQLLSFLLPQQQVAFLKQLHDQLDYFYAFAEPEAPDPAARGKLIRGPTQIGFSSEN